MRDFIYTPNLCKGKDAILKGTVTFQLPKSIERKKLIIELNLEYNDNNEVKFTKKDSAVDKLEKMQEITARYIKSVNIENKETKQKHKSFEDLEYDPYCDELLVELGHFLINGMSLGKRQG